jgi:RIO kinase 1
MHAPPRRARGTQGMGSGLEHLLAEGVISEVVARLQSGKEAEVYVVRFGGRVVAAKVYKNREHRSFKNNAAYKEGRAVRNTRSQRAIDRGSRFGKAVAEDAWKSAEADALYKLHAAEVRVPTPVLFLDGVLLMELVLDAEGNAARRLIDTDLTAVQARAAYHDMLTQLVRILACDLIHGDLSPYNVLWAAAGPTLIDFPQVISASHNSSSQRFFLRDAENILGHFVRVDRALEARRSDAWEIWQAYVRRELTPEFLPTGRARPVAHAPRVVIPPAQRTHTPRPGPVDAIPSRARQAPHGSRPPPQEGRRVPPSGHSRVENAASQHRSHGGPPRPGAPSRPYGGARRPTNVPEVIVRHHRPLPSALPPSPAQPVQPPPADGTQPSGENAHRPAHRRRRRR